MSHESEAELLLGTRIDATWRLEAVLGAGGVGTVFAARDATKRRVALKLLHRDLVDKAHVRVRLFREAELAQKLSHPAIVPVLGSGTSEAGTPYLISELVEGPSLEELRLESGGRLDIALVERVGIALLDALSHAHARGIVHRDLKPANLMLGPDDAVRVLDFGLARVLEADLAEGVTSADAVIGTAGFMAPEQAQGRWDLIDARTDLWAVGATLLKLATGVDVHDGHTVQENLALAATKGVERLHERAPDLPAAWISILTRALSFRREDRFANAAEFRDAIAGRTYDENDRRDANAPAFRKTARLPMLAGAAGVLVLAAVALAAFVRSPRAAPVPSRISETLPGEAPRVTADIPSVFGLASSSAPAVAPSLFPAPKRRDVPTLTSVTRPLTTAPSVSATVEPVVPAQASATSNPLDVRR